MYLGGKVTFLREGLGELEGTAFHPSLLSHLSLGDSRKVFSQPLSGEVTLGRVWARALGEEEEAREARCGRVAREGRLLDWQVARLARGEEVEVVEREGECPLQLEEGSRLVGFPRRLKFLDAGVACEGLGGTQVNRQSI